MIVVLCSVFLLTINSQSQQLRLPADITEEPHHRLIFENNQVRVFAVSIRAYQEAFVQHAHNSLTVTLQDSEIAIWTDDQPVSLNFSVPQGSARFFPEGIVR